MKYFESAITKKFESMGSQELFSEDDKMKIYPFDAAICDFGQRYIDVQNNLILRPETKIIAIGIHEVPEAERSQVISSRDQISIFFKRLCDKIQTLPENKRPKIICGLSYQQVANIAQRFGFKVGTLENFDDIPNLEIGLKLYKSSEAWQKHNKEYQPVLVYMKTEDFLNQFSKSKK